MKAIVETLRALLSLAAQRSFATKNATLCRETAIRISKSKERITANMFAEALRQRAPRSGISAKDVFMLTRYDVVADAYDISVDVFIPQTNDTMCCAVRVSRTTLVSAHRCVDPYSFIVERLLREILRTLQEKIMS